MSSTKGTAVPPREFVEKVYVNTSLSVEEVVSIINNANLEYTIGGYKVCGHFDNNAMVTSIELSNLGSIVIVVHDTVIFRESDPSGNSFVGWDENFDGVVEINQYNYFGTQNDALTELFSITPFTQAQGEKVIVSKSKLIAIADNIRNQTGTTDLITLDEMANIKLGSGSGKTELVGTVTLTLNDDDIYNLPFNFDDNCYYTLDIINPLDELMVSLNGRYTYGRLFTDYAYSEHGAIALMYYDSTHVLIYDIYETMIAGFNNCTCNIYKLPF